MRCGLMKLNFIDPSQLSRFGYCFSLFGERIAAMVPCKGRVDAISSRIAFFASFLL